MLRGRITRAGPDDAVLSQRKTDVEVNQADIPVGPAHQVGRLYVAVDITPGRRAVGGTVQVFQRLQKLYGPLNHLGL